MFSIPYSAIENVVFAGKDKKIATIDDLKGPAASASPRGTPSKTSSSAKP